jgi:cardiolipin synthase
VTVHAHTHTHTHTQKMKKISISIPPLGTVPPLPALALLRAAQRTDMRRYGYRGGGPRVLIVRNNLTSFVRPYYSCSLGDCLQRYGHSREVTTPQPMVLSRSLSVSKRRVQTQLRPQQQLQSLQQPQRRSITSFLKNLIPAPENRTIPNMISISRILCSPGLAVAIYYDMKGVALAGCVLAGFTDWLDGYLAKNYDMKSELGAFLDPLGDKVVIGSLAAGLTLKGLLPVPLMCVIVGRDVFLVACSFVIRYMEKPPDVAFFDIKTATFKVTPSTFSKVNTAIQFGLLTLTLGHFAFAVPAAIETLEPLWWLTAATTIGSGAGYLSGAGVTAKEDIKDLVDKFTRRASSPLGTGLKPEEEVPPPSPSPNDNQGATRQNTESSGHDNSSSRSVPKK